MGCGASTTEPPLSNPQQGGGDPQVEKQVKKLCKQFPNWDPEAIADVLSQCNGDTGAARALIKSWKDEVDDTNRGRTEQVPHEQSSRAGYNQIIRAQLLRRAPSVFATFKTAMIFKSRAKLAKSAASRNKQLGHTPRSFTQEGKKLMAEKAKMNREEKIQDGMQLLQQRMTFLKLRLMIMADDGNCQFRALSHELYGHQRWHKAVRERVVAWLEKHSDDYSAFVGTDDDWKAYMDRMRNDRTWGDEITLRAASEAYGCSVHVVTTEKDNWLLHYGKQPGKNVAELFLAYVSPIHYNVVALPKNK